MKRLLGYVLLPAVLALTAQVSPADTLLLEKVTAAAHTKRPRSGQTLKRVVSEWGNASETMPAVGDPPITRLVYPNFTVYFEHDRVIHSVVNR